MTDCALTEIYFFIKICCGWHMVLFTGFMILSTTVTTILKQKEIKQNKINKYCLCYGSQPREDEVQNILK
jgi:hypothetical protein